MRKRVWVFQFKRDVQRKGDGASWYVGWYSSDGKRRSESCGPGRDGEKRAERLKRKKEAELLLDLEEPGGRVSWSRFLDEYRDKVFPEWRPRSREQVESSLRRFERICKPGRMDRITVHTVDRFKAERQGDRGKNKGSKLSAASVNRDLRHVQAALRQAEEWGYMKAPKVRMLKEPEKLARYVEPEHFGAIYLVCDKAGMPEGQSCGAGDWWRALLTFAYMTGWRISELLSLRWEDVDLDARTALTRHSDNKGGRDELVPLHPVVVEHLERIRGFGRLVFPWPHAGPMLWRTFHRLQRLAGIHLPCREDHEHTASCAVYGFHDLRRAFATINAARMDPASLQRLMRHKDFKTTLKYINASSRLQDIVETMPVPAVLRRQA